MFGKIAVTSNNDKMIRTNTSTMCQKETLHAGYGCVHIEFHSIFMISILIKRTVTERKLVQGQSKNGVKFYVSVILFKEEKNPILKYTNLNTSI